MDRWMATARGAGCHSIVLALHSIANENMSRPRDDHVTPRCSYSIALGSMVHDLSFALLLICLASCPSLEDEAGRPLVVALDLLK